MQEQAAKYRAVMIEKAVAESDDALMDKFIMEEPITVRGTQEAAIRKATIDN